MTQFFHLSETPFSVPAEGSFFVFTSTAGLDFKLDEAASNYAEQDFFASMVRTPFVEYWLPAGVSIVWTDGAPVAVMMVPSSEHDAAAAPVGEKNSGVPCDGFVHEYEAGHIGLSELIERALAQRDAQADDGDEVVGDFSEDEFADDIEDEADNDYADDTPAEGGVEQPPAEKEGSAESAQAAPANVSAAAEKEKAVVDEAAKPAEPSKAPAA